MLRDAGKVAMINAGKSHNIATYENRQTKHVQDIRYGYNMPELKN